MPSVRTLLFVTLSVLGLVFLVRWVQQIRGRQEDAPNVRPSILESTVGFVTNFFDTLGIGSFAPTTSIYKLKNLVPDEDIPGTMHVGHTLPVIIQAFIFIAIIQIDMTTLVAMITAAVLGAWLGAGVVARLPRRKIQIGMGVALLVAAASFVMSIYGVFPGGGDDLGMRGLNLAFAVTGSFILGSLMTIGVGFYAPCMIMVSLLGMNPTTAFPIMMGASAFLMPVASVRFLRAEKYRLRPAVGLALGGIPAVLIAAFIVKSLPLNAMRWLVVAVVLYAAVAMLRSAYMERIANVD
jgi:uncharacterized membrane protein YfcA